MRPSTTPLGEVVTAHRDDAEVLPELAPRSPAVAGAVPPRLVDLEAKVAAAISRGRAASTLRAYRSDWADFSTWCAMVGQEALPAGPGTVAAFVAELADPSDDRLPAAASTIPRRLAAIGEGHKVAGHPNPCTEVVVHFMYEGWRELLETAHGDAPELYAAWVPVAGWRRPERGRASTAGQHRARTRIVVGTRLDGRSAMAANTGNGSRKGAVKNRFQLLDPDSGLWTVFSFAGQLLRTKKSSGPFKGVKVGPPKKSKR